MVEAALVLPLLLLVVFAMVELGRAASIMQALDNAAREGARWSAMPAEGTTTLPSVSVVQQRVINFAAASQLTLSAGNISVNQALNVTEGGLPTSFSKVDVTYTYHFVAPMVAAILPSIPLSGHAIMRNETN